MSRESSQRLPALSSSGIGTNVLRDFGEEKISKFGMVCAALWPDKPALILAQRVGCSERAAGFYIRGDRDPSLGAILVIIEEIRGRRRA